MFLKYSALLYCNICIDLFHEASQSHRRYHRLFPTFCLHSRSTLCTSLYACGSTSAAPQWRWKAVLAARTIYVQRRATDSARKPYERQLLTVLILYIHHPPSNHSYQLCIGNEMSPPSTGRLHSRMGVRPAYRACRCAGDARPGT